MKGIESPAQRSAIGPFVPADEMGVGGMAMAAARARGAGCTIAGRASVAREVTR